MKNLLYLLCAILFFSCNQPNNSAETPEAVVLPVAEPSSFGLSQQEINTIQSHLNQAIDSGYIAGAVALIARHDTIIYHEALGYANRDKTTPLTTDHIFRMASMTKPITSTAIMQLVEQGKINLDDPVSKYIPGFANLMVIDQWNEADSSFTTVPAEREVTIHHLLTHTAGFAYSLFNPVAGLVYPQFGITEAWTLDSITLAMNIPKMEQLPLMHQPGERYTYGTNIDVLGYIVEIVSGQPLDEYFQEYIFNPLKIEDMAFYLPEEKSARLVEMWYTSGVDAEQMDGLLSPDYPITGAQTYFPGGAGLVGTSMDYLKFASAILNKGTLGNAQILKPETVDLMMANQIDSLRTGPGQGFGYGGMVRVEEDSVGRNVGYWGWDGFWQTRFRIDPQNDMVLILLTNAYPAVKWDDVLGGYGANVVKAIETE